MSKVPTLQKSCLVHDRSVAAVFGAAPTAEEEALEEAASDSRKPEDPTRPVHHYVTMCTSITLASSVLATILLKQACVK